jgi:hypothetical protein
MSALNFPLPFSHPLSGYCFHHDALISDSLMQGTVTNFPHCGHLSVTSTFSLGISDISKARRPQFEHFIFFAIERLISFPKR